MREARGGEWNFDEPWRSGSREEEIAPNIDTVFGEGEPLLSPVAHAPSELPTNASPNPPEGLEAGELEKVKARLFRLETASRKRGLRTARPRGPREPESTGSLGGKPRRQC